MTPQVNANPDAGNLSTRTLGDLATSIAGATGVFRRHRLDFCCGGDVSLAVAATRRGLDPAAISRELCALEPRVSSVHPGDPTKLTRYIVARFHDAHRAQLPELIRLAHKVERVHADRPGVPAGLAALLEQLQQGLLDHMAIEETTLFPMMCKEPDADATDPIATMRADHAAQGGAVEDIFALTGELKLPEGACNTWRALYLGLQQFADDLIEHVHTENNVLFKRYEAATPAGAKSPGAAGNSDFERASHE